MKRNTLIFAGLACILSLSACTSTNTPAYRIAHNPEVYHNLPKAEQELVTQGKICEGMTPKAVFLAWGYPNTTPFQGTKDGKNFIRWVYTRNQAVTTFNNWSGPVWGPMGWYDPLYGNSFGGSATTFVPTNVAMVSFEGGKVVAWQKEKPKGTLQNL